MKAVITKTRKLMPVALALFSLVAAIGCSKDSKDNPMSSSVPEAAQHAGTYTTNYRWGGANGLWRGSTPLTITANGDVTYGGTKIINPTFGNDRLSWSMADGNHTNADVNFKTKDDSDFFWRDYGSVDKMNRLLQTPQKHLSAPWRRPGGCRRFRWPGRRTRC